ncbi:hypothetical protein ACVWWG_000280 [Bradyrhizobium sp. LB7.2]
MKDRLIAELTEHRTKVITSIGGSIARKSALASASRKMSQVLDELKKQAEDAETKALALPQNPERDQLLCDLANFRATLAKRSHECEMDQG